MNVTFIVKGEPKGKARPKVAIRGGYAHAYTPSETVEYENYVRLMYSAQCESQFLHGAIRAEITAYFKIPKSTSKKRSKLMLINQIKYIKKPDVDNIAKSILDSLNGIAFDDDSQICELSIVKKYGQEPCVQVNLSEIDVDDKYNEEEVSNEIEQMSFLRK